MKLFHPFIYRYLCYVYIKIAIFHSIQRKCKNGKFQRQNRMTFSWHCNYCVFKFYLCEIKLSVVWKICSQCWFCRIQKGCHAFSITIWFKWVLFVCPIRLKKISWKRSINNKDFHSFVFNSVLNYKKQLKHL